MSQVLYGFLQWCPGAFGLVLRQKIYPRLLGGCGKGVLIGRFVKLVHPQRIFIGDRVIISNDVTLDASGSDGKTPEIRIENNVFLGSGTRLFAKRNSISMQSGTNIGSSCTITADVPVYVGKHVLFAAYCDIGTHPPEHSDKTGKNLSDTVQSAATVVEYGCWLGVRTEVYSGVTVRKESIVGAHSIVDREVPPWAIVVGQPFKVLRYRKKPELHQDIESCVP